MIRANLIASENHSRFAAGTSVASVMFVEAADIEAAEEMAAKHLADSGWSRMEIERHKIISDYSQFNENETVVGQAFRDSLGSGFGIVVYPEPGT